MRDLAALLFGDPVDEPADLFEPGRGRRARVRDSAEWCQSTPGAEASGWLGFALGAPGRPGRRRGRGSAADAWCERD
ncbi:MAG TPA: hypothetical protein VKG80_13155 [Trebonia sp.]|nr:hypothetical protein [Trebonia sp.]